MKEKIIQDILYSCESCGAEYYEKPNIWKCQLCGKNEICSNCKINIFEINEWLSNKFSQKGIFTVCPECSNKIKKNLINRLDQLVSQIIKDSRK